MNKLRVTAARCFSAAACSILMACGGSEAEKTVTFAAYVPPTTESTRMYYFAVERELRELGVDVLSRECGPFLVDVARFPNIFFPIIVGGEEWFPYWTIYYTVPAGQAHVVSAVPRLGNELSRVSTSLFQFLVRPGACGDLPESIIGPATGF